MDKQIWYIAGGITTAFLIGVLVLTAVTKSKQAAQARAELADAQAIASRAEARAKALQDKLAESQERIAELEKEKDAAVQSHQSLEDEMRAALESRDVTISQLQGKLTVNILDRLMFDSGEAQIKPDGEAVRREVDGREAETVALITSRPPAGWSSTGNTGGLKTGGTPDWTSPGATMNAACETATPSGGMGSWPGWPTVCLSNGEAINPSPRTNPPPTSPPSWPLTTPGASSSQSPPAAPTSIPLREYALFSTCCLTGKRHRRIGSMADTLPHEAF